MTNDTTRIDELKNHKLIEAFEILEGISRKDFDEKDWNRFERFISVEKIEEEQEQKQLREAFEGEEKIETTKHAVCSDLEILNIYDESTNHLDAMVNLQAETQKNVYGYDYANMSLRELSDFNHMNNHAIIDELHEFTDSLGGIKDGDGSAIWKRWKKAYHNYKDIKFSDLTESDQLEAKFEVVDIFHFVLTQCAMVNMDAKELFNMYMSKNKENIDRQNRGY